MKKVLQVLSIVLFANFLTAGSCSSGGGGGGTTTPPEPVKPGTAQVAGKWSLTQTFTWSNHGIALGSRPAFTITLQQNGTAITGTCKFGPISGTVTGTAIKFTITDEDIKTFKGVVSGNTMSGTFDENFEDDLLRRGTWKATKQ